MIITMAMTMIMMMTITMKMTMTTVKTITKNLAGPTVTTQAPAASQRMRLLRRFHQKSNFF